RPVVPRPSTPPEAAPSRRHSTILPRQRFLEYAPIAKLSTTGSPTGCKRKGERPGGALRPLPKCVAGPARSVGVNSMDDRPAISLQARKELHQYASSLAEFIDVARAFDPAAVQEFTRKPDDEETFDADRVARYHNSNVFSVLDFVIFPERWLDRTALPLLNE